MFDEVQMIRLSQPFHIAPHNKKISLLIQTRREEKNLFCWLIDLCDAKHAATKNAEKSA